MVAEMPPYTTHDKFLVSLVSILQLVHRTTLQDRKQEDHIYELSIFHMYMLQWDVEEDLRSVGRDNRGTCSALFFFFSTPLHEFCSVKTEILSWFSLSWSHLITTTYDKGDIDILYHCVEVNSSGEPPGKSQTLIGMSAIHSWNETAVTLQRL